MSKSMLSRVVGIVNSQDEKQGGQYTGMAGFGHARFRYSGNGAEGHQRGAGFMDANFSDKGELIPYLHNQRILWYHRAPELCRRRIFSQPASRVAVFASNRLMPC